MDKSEMMQKCLDLSNAAQALFDLIESEDISAPLDSVTGVMILAAVVEPFEDIRGYYMRRNVQRMLVLGVSPENLLRQAQGHGGG